jgi:excisionase family DNA binding protein
MVPVRLAQSIDPADDGIAVAEAACILGCDHTTVRHLLRIGELGGWRVGKTTRPRGVRISRLSCEDYKDRNAIRADKPSTADSRDFPPNSRPSRHTREHLEALAWLRARGVRI